MVKTEKVSARQVILIITLSRLFIAFSYLPALNVPPGDQDNWIVILYSIIITIIVFFPLLYLGNKFKEYSLIEYMQIVLGKNIGKVMGCLYGVAFIIAGIFYTGIEAESIGTSMLFNTPNSIKILFLLITCIYIVSKGLEVMVRSAEFFGPLIIIILLFLIALGYQNWEFDILLPVLAESSLKEINIGAVNIAFKFIDLLFLFMVVPNLEDKTMINKIFIKTLVYSVILVTLPVVACQITLGLEYVMDINYPFFVYTRLINVGRIFQRVELIYVVVWIVSAIIKVSSTIYLASLAFQQVFKKKEMKNIIYIVGSIIYLSSVYIVNRRPIVSVKEPLEAFTFSLAVILIFVIPTITLIVDLFRSGKKDSSN